MTKFLCRYHIAGFLRPFISELTPGVELTLKYTRGVNTTLACGRHVEETLIGTSEQLGHIVSPCPRDRRQAADLCDARMPETSSLETGNRAGPADYRGCLRRETYDIRAHAAPRPDNRTRLSRDMRVYASSDEIENEICEAR